MSQTEVGAPMFSLHNPFKGKHLGGPKCEPWLSLAKLFETDTWTLPINVFRVICPWVPILIV